MKKRKRKDSETARLAREKRAMRRYAGSPALAFRVRVHQAGLRESLNEAVEGITRGQLVEDWAGEVAKLAAKYWGSRKQPYWRPGKNPTVDIVILRPKGRTYDVLLVKRKNPPNKGSWALPGGFHDTNAPKGARWKAGKETAKQAALRELREETHLKLGALLKSLKLKLVGKYEGGGRDKRDNKESWSTTTAFAVVLPANAKNTDVKAGDDAAEAKWTPLRVAKRRRLAFDHGKILRDALKVLNVV